MPAASAGPRSRRQRRRRGGRECGRSRGSRHWGGLRIAVVMSTGWMPPFETVNVPPATSAGMSEPSRARAARSTMRALISASESLSAPATTGATSPSDVSTATATLISASSSTSRLGHAGVEERVFAERRRDELHDDRRDPDRRRCSRLVEPGPQLDERLDVDLEHGGQLGGGLETRNHAGGDRAATTPQRDRASPPSAGRPGRGSGLRLPEPARVSAHVCDIAIGDAPAGPGPGDLAGVVEVSIRALVSRARARGETSGTPPPAPSSRAGPG